MSAADKAAVSQEDILAKMDALLKKHHIGHDNAPDEHTDFPVLTEIVEAPAKPPSATEQEIVIDFDIDASDDFPVLEEVLPGHDEPEAFIFSDEAAPAPDVTATRHHESEADDDDAFREPPRPVPPLHEATMLEQRIADHIIASMDKALGNMLLQFSSHLESMVRETVAQELNRQLTALLEPDDARGGTPD